MRNLTTGSLKNELIHGPAPSKLSRAISAAVFGLGVSIAGTGAHAASIQVTSNTDNGAMCTLREAIESVNAGAVGSSGCISTGVFGTNDTITFANSGTISLTAGELLLDSDVTIDASSISGITVRGSSASRVMTVAESTSVMLDQITVKNGNAVYGGGILVEDFAALSLTDSEVSANSADLGGGIALGLSAELTIVDSVVSGNNAVFDGGGIYFISGVSPMSGPLVSLTGTTLHNNTANDMSFGGSGGGLAGFDISYSVIDITNSQVTNNIASYYGGGIYLGGEGNEITISGGEISGNTAGFDGGGLSFQSQNDKLTLSIVGATVSMNQADRHGGGLSVNGIVGDAGDTVTIESAIFDGNTSLSDGAGMYANEVSLNVSASTFIGNVANDSGGAMLVFNSDFTLSDSTVSNNAAGGDGGGLFSDNLTLAITRSTFNGNSAAYLGGGVYSADDGLNVSNSTLSANSAGDSGGALYNNTNGATFQLVTITENQGGGIFDASGSSTLLNSIVANSVSGFDCGGTVIVDSASIIEDGSCAANRIGDPSLLPLADNGGPTQTHALDTSSLALNTGSNASCLPTDQRGELRNDGACDVGAYEEPSQEDDGFIVIPIKRSGKVVVIPN